MGLLNEKLPKSKMGRTFDRLFVAMLLIIALLAAAWAVREDIVTCNRASYCVVHNRWTGNLTVREP